MELIVLGLYPKEIKFLFSKSNYESQEGAEGRTFWYYIGCEAMNTEINKNARDDLFKQLISQIQYAFVKEIQLFNDSIFFLIFIMISVIFRVIHLRSNLLYTEAS